MSDDNKISIDVNITGDGQKQIDNYPHWSKFPTST